MQAILDTVVPVFALVGLGWLLARWRSGDLPGLTRLTVDVFAPALVLEAFLGMRFESEGGLALVGGTLVILAVTGVAGLLARPLLAAPHRGVMLPILFWNAGNMGLSVVRLGLGEEALPAAAVVFVTVAALNAIVGAWIARGPGGLTAVLRMPLVWACVLGGLGSGLGWEPPRMVAEPLSLLAAPSIPLMLLNLGMTLRGLRLEAVRDAALAVTCRMGVGLAAGLAFVHLLDVQGLVRQVLLIEASLPPAVISVLFAERYRAAPQTVASTVLLGTLLSVVTLPLVLAFVL